LRKVSYPDAVFVIVIGNLRKHRRFQMSTGNIISIEPVNDVGGALAAGAIAEEFAVASLAAPSAVDVTFQVRKGTVTYRYTDPEAVSGILAGEDPAAYAGAGTRIS
jgi:hypothetical protein